MNAIQHMKIDAVAVRWDSLREINEQAFEHGYNRRIDWESAENYLRDYLADRGLDVDAIRDQVTMLLTPIMLHHHKAMQPCEPHYRCSVELLSTDQTATIPCFQAVWIDICADTWALMCSARDIVAPQEVEFKKANPNVSLIRCDYARKYLSNKEHVTAQAAA